MAELDGSSPLLEHSCFTSPPLSTPALSIDALRQLAVHLEKEKDELNFTNQSKKKKILRMINLFFLVRGGEV